MLLLITVVLVGAALTLLLVGRGNAGPYILALLALLSAVGVFSLFLLATGILRLSSYHPNNPKMKADVGEGSWWPLLLGLIALVVAGYMSGVLTLLAATPWAGRILNENWNLFVISLATLCLGFGIAAILYGCFREAQARALREQYDDLRTRANNLATKYDAFEQKSTAPLP